MKRVGCVVQGDVVEWVSGQNLDIRPNGGLAMDPGCAAFCGNVIRNRICECMAFARARGKLHSKQPRLSDCQPRELRRIATTGAISVSDLIEVSSASSSMSIARRGRRRVELNAGIHQSDWIRSEVGDDEIL